VKALNDYEEFQDRISRERKLKEELDFIFDKLGLRSYGQISAYDCLENLVEVLVRKNILSEKDFKYEA